MRSCSRSLAGVCATVRVGLTGAVVEDGEAVSNRPPILPQADSVNATHSKAGAAKRPRPVIPSRRPARSVTSAHMPGSGFENAQSSCLSMISEQTLPFVEGKPVPTFPDHALFPAEHFNLPHPEHFYS